MINERPPAVTVGIPFYNAEKTLADAIRSVYAQTFKDWELLLIDDGSTDGSLKIARSVRDSRVRVISDGRNLTLAPRLNQIARMARAPLLARMDADDLMHPQRLDRQVHFLADRTDVDVVGTGAYSMCGSQNLRGKRKVGPIKRRELDVALRVMFIHPTIMGRRAWFLANPYNESDSARRCEDYDLWLRTFRSACFDIIPEALLFYTEDVVGILSKSWTAVEQSGRVLGKHVGVNLSYPAVAVVRSVHFLKMYYYEAYCALAKPERLLARRNIPLTEEEMRKANAVLARIASSSVPGLDETISLHVNMGEPLPGINNVAVLHKSPPAEVPNRDELVMAGFGDEWSRFDQSLLTEIDQRSIFSEYFSIFPWEQLHPKAVGADIGCGTGRWAKLVAPRVGELHCVDPSRDALRVARRNLSHQRNVHFHESSADALPFPDSSLDFAYSLGVLHHVPDTAAAIRNISSKLKPGAPFLIYVYYAFDNRPAWFIFLWRVSDRVRRAVSRWPFGLRYAASQVLAVTVYWPLARLARIVERIVQLPENWPLAAYKNRAFYVMRTDALDRFGTRMEQRFTRSQIQDMLETAGFKRVRFSNHPPYWCAVADKG